MELTTISNENYGKMNNFLNLSLKLIESTANIEMLDYIDEFHRVKINDLLNELSCIDYKFLQISSDCEPCIKLIDCLKSIPITEDTLVVKSCCLLVAIFKKGAIPVPGVILKSAILWIVKSINHNKNLGITDALEALQMLVKGCSEIDSEISELIIGPNGLLIKLLQNPHVIVKKSEQYESCSTDEITFSAIICLEAFIPLTIADISEEHADIILAEVIKLIYTINCDTYSRISFCSIVAAALNVCRYICLDHSDLCEKYAGDLIGAAKTFMLFGLSAIDVWTPPMKVAVSQQALGEPAQLTSKQKGGKVAKLKKPRIKKDKRKAGKLHRPQNTATSMDIKSDSNTHFDTNFTFPSITSTSQSDFSETENGFAQRNRQKHTIVRLAALNLIAALGKSMETKQLFGYWHTLFPTDNCVKYSAGLLECIAKDPNIKCRISALQAASVIVLDSKVFLTQAEYRKNKPKSYIPFSVFLGDIIMTMYDTLIRAMETESSLLVLIQLLTFLTVLIQVTPFKRLQAGFVPRMVIIVRRLVFHTDVTIQVAALKVLEFLISPNDISEEICKCTGIAQPCLKATINQNHLYDDIDKHTVAEMQEGQILNVEEQCDNIDDETEEQMVVRWDNDLNEENGGWLLKTVLTNIGVAKESTDRSTIQISTSVRLQSWLILNTMASQYMWLNETMVAIEEAIKIALLDPLPDIKLCGVKCFDIFGYSMNTYLLSQDSLSEAEINNAIRFWKGLISVVVPIIQDFAGLSTGHLLKTICCDALSNIGIHVYEKLKVEKQILLISLMTGCAFDPDELIRGAAIRTLAVYVHFPTLRDDPCYVENVAEAIISALNDGKLELRVKASWALGNITDAIVTKSLSSSALCVREDLLFRLIETSLTCKTNDKVRCNGVRAIGKLLRLVSAKLLENKAWGDICMRAIQELHQCCIGGGFIKVKWNACYAMGNFMRNCDMFYELTGVSSGARGFNWMVLIFPALTQVVVGSPNFKVRINAAAALAIPEKRNFIAEYLQLIWKSLLEALEHSDHITDLNEYQHRDNLKEQLCISISHYIKLMEPVDMVMVQDFLANYESIHSNWIRIINRMLPEKAAPLLAATRWLNNRKLDMNDLTTEQKKALSEIICCFSPPTIYI